MKWPTGSSISVAGALSVSVMKIAYIAGMRESDLFSKVFVKGVIRDVSKEVVIQRNAVIFKYNDRWKPPTLG